MDERKDQFVGPVLFAYLIIDWNTLSCKYHHPTGLEALTLTEQALLLFVDRKLFTISKISFEAFYLLTLTPFWETSLKKKLDLFRII